MDDPYQDDQYNKPPKIDNSENAEKWESAFSDDTSESSESDGSDSEKENDAENSLKNLLAALGDASGYDGINTKITQALSCDPDDLEQVARLIEQHDASYDASMEKSEAYLENNESAKFDADNNSKKKLVQAASQAIKEFHLRYNQIQNEYGQKALNQGTDIAHFVFNDADNEEPVSDVTFSAFCSRIHMGESEEANDDSKDENQISHNVAEQTAQYVNDSFENASVTADDIQELVNSDIIKTEKPAAEATAEEIQEQINKIYEEMEENNKKESSN